MRVQASITMIKCYCFFSDLQLTLALLKHTLAKFTQTISVISAIDAFNEF